MWLSNATYSTTVHIHGCFLHLELCRSIFPSVICSLNVPIGITPHGIVLSPVQVSGAHSSLSVGWWCCQLAGRWMTTVPMNGHASWSASAIISISYVYQPCGCDVCEMMVLLYWKHIVKEIKTQIKTLEQLVEIAVYFVLCHENCCWEHNLVCTTLTVVICN